MTILKSLFLAIFKMLAFFQLAVFWSRFLDRTTETCCKKSFYHVLMHLKFLTQSDDFPKSMAFAWWPFLAIFKMLSFFDY